MRRTYYTLITALLIVAVSQAQLAAADGPVNLLVNPSFEGLYVTQCCENTTQFQVNTPIQQVQVAYGWTPWWVEPDASHPNHCSGCVPYSRPQFNSTTLTHSGAAAQTYYTTFAIHEAGVYQRVSGITLGQRLQFSAYMYFYSNLDNPFTVRVGIDPTGGTNPFSPSVVWGPSYSAFNSWLLFTAEAVAQNSTVTVFTYSKPSWPYQTEAVYLDDASLNVAGPLPSGAVVLTQTGNGRVLTGVNSPIAPAGSISAPITSNPGTYVVQRGDNLYRLSKRFGVTVDAIKKANNLKSDVIQIGQTLIIPAP